MAKAKRATVRKTVAPAPAVKAKPLAFHDQLRAFIPAVSTAGMGDLLTLARQAERVELEAKYLAARVRHLAQCEGLITLARIADEMEAGPENPF